MTTSKHEWIGIKETAVFFPDTFETAEVMSSKTGIPTEVIIEKFGLYQKYVSDQSIHASHLAIQAARNLKNVDFKDIDVIIYFGSPHKDYQVWSIAPKIQHELGATKAFAFEMMNVSANFPIALKVAKDMLASDHFIQNILLVGGCKESQIIDYSNPRSRFMFNFGDGGAAALVQRGYVNNQILQSHVITDGSFHDDIKIPAGGSVLPASEQTVRENLHYIDVKDPFDMKERLDPVSGQNFVNVVKEAVEKSGFQLKDIDLLLPLHTKKSLFRELLAGLGLREEQAIYLDHFGHMSALDPLVGLHLAKEQGRIKANDLIVTVSAGTGYTWAATVIQWRE